MSKKYVYSFKEGNQEMRSLLGGKGANLAEMTRMGINVPTGFSITTEACNRFLKEDHQIWDSLFEEIQEHIEEVEESLGKKFSDTENPLLFSVRSGAVISMPGMMDTILNLGLNDQAVKGLAKSTQNEAFAYDSYRRFIQMFSDVAMEIPAVLFENRLAKMKARVGVDLDNELGAQDLKDLVEEYKEIYRQEMGQDFPQDPMDQLRLAVESVFRSWENPRAAVYRRLNEIPDDLGTAVNVQSMVFGNMGETSGTGVAFSRHPSTGENKLFGEYLMNAQGEDVVAGIRTPEPISHLEDLMPEVYQEFLATAEKLEKHYQDMQDLEFTIERGTLYILQTRNGKRTAQAALAIAVDMVQEGLITKEEAILRVEANSLNQLLHPNFDPQAIQEAQSIVTGLAASPGAASGQVYFHAEDAVRQAAAGKKAILLRQETSPEDIEGMHSAEGIVTSRGGMTSHAAVVARGMGKPCVAGASTLIVNEAKREATSGDILIKEGDEISIDGSTGAIYLGLIPQVQPELVGHFGQFMDWVDEIKRMEVRANADSPQDAQQALEFGAVGIGLTRTEHMFFSEDRITAVREMILADNREERIQALEKIRPMQEKDFFDIYQVMGDLPVTIRLLDPPLHEFLPTQAKDIQHLAQEMGLSVDRLEAKIRELQEVNPMLGHRGCRLAITYPEVYRMQARAIMTAALRIKEEKNIQVFPEIMIPLAGDPKELALVKAEVEAEIQEVFDEFRKEIDYHIGAMIEIPRAAILADQMAQESDFFSFGTNDLTQMTMGFSRDDAQKFLGIYQEQKIYPVSPFERIDEAGVGFLVDHACQLARASKPQMSLGVCGEHGGDPKTIHFFERVGLDYVSCSPFRVPIARLAAAQASLLEKKN